MRLPLVFLIFVTLLTGCATVIRGSSQPVTFNSEPEGAQVIINGNLRGRTPMTVNLKKNEFKNVMFKKQGYETKIVPLTTSYDSIAILNVFWDSSTTDLATGNAYEYSPDIYNVQLVKSGNAESKN